MDPLFQDLDQNSRKYLHYFAMHVCKDLVCYDVPNHNPFRDLISLARGYPALFHILIAISALHISNVSHGSVSKRLSMVSHLPTTLCNEVQHKPISPALSSKDYEYALIAKQKALKLLRQAIDNTQPADLEIVLASVLLFAEFELIDSGRDDWRFHISGAKRLINSLLSSSIIEFSNMSRLCSDLISNCVIYDILGSALAHLAPYKALFTSSIQVLSTLESAEANNYLSCPAMLLQLVLTATEVSHSIPRDPAIIPTSISSTTAQQISLVLLTARSFDAVAWATDLQKISPHKDAKKCEHIASAHKAAVCIYISRASSLFSQAIDFDNDLERWCQISSIIYLSLLATTSFSRPLLGLPLSLAQRRKMRPVRNRQSKDFTSSRTFVRGVISRARLKSLARFGTRKTA